MRLSPEQFWTYFEWMIERYALLQGFLLVLILAAVGFVVGFVVALLKHGPAEGFLQVSKLIRELFVVDIPQTSVRRPSGCGAALSGVHVTSAAINAPQARPAAPLELMPAEEPAPERSAAPRRPAARAPAGAPAADASSNERAAAQKVFEAKFREPNPRLPAKWEPRAREYILLADAALARFEADQGQAAGHGPGATM